MASSQQHPSSPRRSRMTTLLTVATACYLLSLTSTSPTSPSFFLSVEASPVPATKEQLRWIASHAVQIDQDPLSLMIISRKRASPSSANAAAAVAFSLKDGAISPASRQAKRHLEASSASAADTTQRSQKKRYTMDGQSVAHHERRRRSLYSAYEAIVNSDSQMPVFLTHDHIARKQSKKNMVDVNNFKPIVRLVVPSSSSSAEEAREAKEGQESDRVADSSAVVVITSEDKTLASEEETTHDAANAAEPKVPVMPAASFLDAIVDEEEKIVESLPEHAANDADVVVEALDTFLEQTSHKVEDVAEQMMDAVVVLQQDQESLPAQAPPTTSTDATSVPDGDAPLSFNSIPEASSETGEEPHEQGSQQQDYYEANMDDQLIKGSLTQNNNNKAEKEDDDDLVVKVATPGHAPVAEPDEVDQPSNPRPAPYLHDDDYMHDYAGASLAAPSSASDISWSLLQWVLASSSMLLVGLALAVVYIGYRLYVVRRSTTPSNTLLPFAQSSSSSSARNNKGHHHVPMEEKQQQHITTSNARPSPSSARNRSLSNCSSAASLLSLNEA